MNDPTNQSFNQPTKITPPIRTLSRRAWWFTNYSMRTRLIIVFLLVGLIPLGVLTYVNYRITQDLLVKATSQPDALLTALTESYIVNIGFFLVIVVLAVVFLAFNVAGPLTGSLARLTGLTQQVAGGALGLEIPVESGDEVGQLAESFNSMTVRLRDLTENLDQHIAARTGALENIIKALQTSTQIGRQMTTILDLDELLKYVVDHIQVEFDFYYTQIYLVEEESGDLVLAKGSGEVGQQLQEKAHRLPAGQGIVGTVASTNEFFLSNDVSQVLNFVYNPLLPDTRAELALPLRKGEQVLGVLDIQCGQTNRFTPEDVSLMQSVANQLAIALDNARLLAETQAAFQEVEYLNRRLMREAWEEFGQEVTTAGYQFIGGAGTKIRPVSDVWLPPMSQAAAQKQLVKRSLPGNGEPAKAELAVPLVLRGEVIGVLGIKREETTDWDEEELAAVEAVANQVSLALENARLSQEQEKTIVQLQDVDRIKSEFLTSMSHELRTPLNSIIGFADVLLQGIDGELNEMATNDIQLIYNSGQHLLALINDILDISKIEAGKMELVREAVDVKIAFSDVLAASGSLVKDKPVEIVLEAEETLAPVYADKLRFNQILLNLVSNAAKFTEEGTITIRAEVPDQTPDKMLISVIDTGIGIPPDKADTVFDRFHQADSSTTRQYGGTGLGLTICRQLVEMHGGEIGVTSEEGAGSEFYFTIPLVSEEISV
jgi:signal transduction histidine kinase